MLGFICGLILQSVENTNQQNRIVPKKVIPQPILVSMRITATAYNSINTQTDNSPWITASGTRCHYRVIANNTLPFGTLVWIKGYGKKPFIVEDRMNARYNYEKCKEHHIDIWMGSYDKAIKFGKRKIVITYFVKPKDNRVACIVK